MRRMHLARFLRSLGGTCHYCGQQTGLLQRDHPECRQTHQAGFTEMVRIAAQSASAHTFNSSKSSASATSAGSILVTTNLPFDEWTEVFGSERLTGALLDRLTHHIHILEMNGGSCRLKRSRESAASQASDGPDAA